MSTRLHIIMMRVAMLLLWAVSPLNIAAQLNTDQVTRIGQNALYFEDYMVAIGYFNQVIAAKPYLAKPYFYRAIAKLSLDDFAGAEADASTAIEKNPFITDAYEVRGVARQNMGKPQEAIDDYRRVLLDKPDSRNVLYNMAIAQVETADSAAAASTFSTLISRYPRYDGGYIARSRFLLERGDTIAALADASKAIDLNANAVNAYIIRADIADKLGERSDSTAAALDPVADMDMAIKLQPQSPGLYINRAYLRYKNDDYRGAMADFDYALQLDPVNIVALYNRGMLRAEVHDFNNSIADLSEVIARNPSQYRALFNRASLYQQIGDLDNALADIDTVISAFPTFAAARYLKSVVLYEMGRENAANTEYNKSIALAKEKVEMLPDSDIGGARGEAHDETQEAVAARFSSLLRAEDRTALVATSEEVKTRGRIQDTNFAIHLEPMFVLTYYAEPTELKPGTDFLRELDELNATRSLPAQLLIATHLPELTPAQKREREASASYYTSWIANHKPRAIDYFARALDHLALKNHPDAMADLDRAIELTPDFPLALLTRAYLGTQEGIHSASASNPLSDLDSAIALSPRMAAAWYNKGCFLASRGLYDVAIDAFNRAIQLDPGLGEAYYNRGYVKMTLGDKNGAFADLSHAGQLGIAPAYSLIKRMSR